MRLRNKKTGEHGDYKVISAGNLIRVRDCASDESWQYDSLASFNTKWEDYNPTEPLIKDPKIRKAVRAWGDMNQIREAAIQRILIEPRGFEDSWFQISGEDENNCIWKIEIHAPYSETVSKDYKENMVTITELCGDEE